MEEGVRGWVGVKDIDRLLSAYSTELRVTVLHGEEPYTFNVVGIAAFFFLRAALKLDGRSLGTQDLHLTLTIGEPLALSFTQKVASGIT